MTNKTGENYERWLAAVNALNKKHGRFQVRNKHTWRAFRNGLTPAGFVALQDHKAQIDT